jgi:2-polyprenyl-6-methoxyphenol hydroxylase-like FAD-dependent oxidoreductase
MNEDVKSKSSVGVIGAGIQGLCISLCLVKKGFKVTLIDHEDPGKESVPTVTLVTFHPMRLYHSIDQMYSLMCLQCYLVRRGR